MILKKIGILLTMLWSLNSFAALTGGSSSSGGDGVVINGVPYLLDFVEGNIHENPFFKDPTNFSQNVASEIERSLGIDRETAQLVAAKLMEVHHKNASFEFLLKWRMIRMQWMIIPEELINVRDEDGVIDFQGKELVQLAVRQGSQVFVNKNRWQQMNAIHRAGLILHEVIYSLRESFNYGRNHSPSVRAVTRNIFQPQFEFLSYEKVRYLLDREGIYVGISLLPKGLKNVLFTRKAINSELLDSSYIREPRFDGNSPRVDCDGYEELRHEGIKGSYALRKASEVAFTLTEFDQILAGQHEKYQVYTPDHIY